MTVEVNRNKIAHVANGVATSFVYDFTIPELDHVQVYFGSVLQASGYTVTGIGVTEGGTVVFDVAPADGVIVTILRELDLVQQTVYRTYGRFPGPVIELDLDKQTMINQQLAEAIGRAVITPVSDEIVEYADFLAARDRAETAADEAEADAVLTAADRVQTGLDRVATGEDVIQSQYWANEAEATAEALVAVDSVSTIADLRATPGGAGVKVIVAGYYTPGDGGGGPLRVWKTGAVGFYVDNGGSIIVPTGGDGSGAWVFAGDGQSESFTVKIPSDYPTIQAAIDNLYTVKMKPGETIELLIETGHLLTGGVYITSGNYSHFKISSVDSEVLLDPLFSNAGDDPSLTPRIKNIFVGRNCWMPIINTLVNMQGADGTGIFAISSELLVLDGAGCKNSGYRGLSASTAAISATGSIFTGSASEGVRLQQSTVAAMQDADVSDCGHTPDPSANTASVFVSRNSTLHFQGGKARNAGDAALRTHRGKIVAVEADVSNSYAAGSAIHGGHIIFRLGNASGCTNGFSLFSQCQLDASGANLQTTNDSVYMSAGGNIVNLYGASGKSGGGQNIINDVGTPNNDAQINIPFREGIVFVDTERGVSEGYYTPVSTGSGNTNTSNVVGSECQWARVGNTITVSGEVTCDFTTVDTYSRFRLSLPRPTNIVGRRRLAGAGGTIDVAIKSVVILGDSGNNLAEFRFVSPPAGTSATIMFTFTYSLS